MTRCAFPPFAIPGFGLGDLLGFLPSLPAIPRLAFPRIIASFNRGLTLALLIPLLPSLRDLLGFLPALPELPRFSLPRIIGGIPQLPALTLPIPSLGDLLGFLPALPIPPRLPVPRCFLDP